MRIGCTLGTTIVMPGIKLAAGTIGSSASVSSSRTLAVGGVGAIGTATVAGEALD
jgi:hypothetical protein